MALAAILISSLTIAMNVAIVTYAYIKWRRS